MDCNYFDTAWGSCGNADCPYCGDDCPVLDNQEVCRYSDLDETEIALRESLDNEKQDSQEALHALAEENQELKKRLAEVTAERDAAVKKLPHVCETCVYHNIVFNGGTLDHDCTNPDGGCSNNYDRWIWNRKGE